ncbi:MAG: radical SAM protein [Ignavibacteriae bacterium]|nr:radical SAM protein [Ignavibacteriota bacterium]
MNLTEILNKQEFTKEEILFLLEIEEMENLNLLFKKSEAVKELYFGRFNNKIASFQFSNNCENNCLYCELREDNISTERFRLSPDEILVKIKEIIKNNITNIILQSGSDSYYDTDMISYLIYRIKKDHDIQITLHLLQRGFDEYRAWKFAGADNYLLKFNSSNKENFSFFNKDNKLDDRINHLKYLKRLGYKICTGNIVGLPNQNKNVLADDILFLKSLEPEMIFNTPFVPRFFSKYQNTSKVEIPLMKKIIAVTRILLQKSDIIISDSVDFFNLNEKRQMFDVGANMLLMEYSGHSINKTKSGNPSLKSSISKGKIVN